MNQKKVNGLLKEILKFRDSKNLAEIICINFIWRGNA